MEVRQRDIWLSDLGEPVGSEAGFLRPVIIVQADGINASRLPTYLAIPLTGLNGRTEVPWNLTLFKNTSGLAKKSMAQTNLTLAVDKSQLVERLGAISEIQLRQLFTCLDVALGRA
jgi:mRNA interferase MazF